MADLSVTAASVVQTAGSSSHGTAGGTVTAGQPVYIDTNDNNSLKAADANAGATEATVEGIALHAAADGQPLAYCPLADGDKINLGATLSVGKIYVLSKNPGGIAPVDDIAAADTMYVTVLGVAESTSVLKAGLNVSGVQAAADVA